RSNQTGAPQLRTIGTSPRRFLDHKLRSRPGSRWKSPQPRRSLQASSRGQRSRHRKVTTVSHLASGQELPSLRNSAAKSTRIARETTDLQIANITMTNPGLTLAYPLAVRLLLLGETMHCICLPCAVLALAALLAPGIGAQTPGTGAVAGVVLDPSGAAVGNATVAVVDHATRIERDVATAADG